VKQPSTPAGDARARPPIYKSLYVQVLVAIAAGVLLGVREPALGEAMRPLGDAFIKLIKMVIGPIIFLTVSLGIAGMRDLKQLGRVGLKTVLYFEIVSTFALGIGLVVVNLARPGAGFGADPGSLDAGAVEHYAGQHAPGVVEFLMRIIPTTPFDALSKGEILGVLFFAVLFGLALSSLGEKARPTVAMLDNLTAVVFRIVHMIVKLAPIGAFGAMAFTVGKYGLASLAPLARLMGSFYATCLLFVLVVLGAIARLAGFSILRFLAYIREELLVVLGTSSSESALPQLMEKLEAME
jgi:aerobic C4-dicarboxylate transport protein